jgi:hypothetical protein
MHTPSGIFRITTLTSALICSALAYSASPLSAQTISDPVFGLAVTAPTGYVAALWTPMPSRNVIIVVQRKVVENAGCIVEFLNGEAGGLDSQADVNARTESAETIERLRSEFSAKYSIQSIDPIEHAGVRGMAMVRDRHQSVSMPDSSSPKKMREWYVVLDTAKGRTTVNCETFRYDFGDRLPEFDAVVRSIAFPK